MKALTVQQPWAWAIALGAKTVENRTTMWKYRGPLAIHAGSRVSVRGVQHPLVRRLAASQLAEQGIVIDPSRDAIQWTRLDFDADHKGAFIATCRIAGAHRASKCLEDHGEQLCSPWAESEYSEQGGRLRRDVVHYELADIVPLEPTIHWPGRLGLWTPPDHVLNQLEQAIA